MFAYSIIQQVSRSDRGHDDPVEYWRHHSVVHGGRGVCQAVQAQEAE